MTTATHARLPGTRWPLLAVLALASSMICAVTYRLLDIPIGDRLLVHDEIPTGPPAINAGIIFGMASENWEFPNYFLALLNGVDGAIGALTRLLTADWRVAKLLQYSIALTVVIAGMWHASGRVARASTREPDAELDALRVIAVACYAMSPYAFTQMNNGTFWAFSVYFAIAFVPVILLEVCTLAAAGDRQGGPGFLFGLMTGICAWWLPLLVVLAWSCVLLMLMAHRPRAPLPVVRFGGLIAGLAIGLVPVFLTSYYSLVQPGYEADFKLHANATFGSISGGILTPLLQRFSWILYVPWDTKAVHSFFADFDSLAVRLTYLGSLGMVVYAALIAKAANSAARLLLAFLLVFAAAIFFAKGSSFPFGQLFASLVDSFAGFGVVRTPDTKFGMTATAAIMLAWLAAGACNRLALRGLLVVGAVYLAAAMSTFFSGALIDPMGPARYRVSLSPDEKQALRLINEADGEGRVLVLPGSGTGAYPYNGYSYVGRNFFPPNIDRPVVSAEAGFLGEKYSVRAALAALAGLDTTSMREMGIRFVLIDKTKRYERYVEFAAADPALVRTLLDGTRVALFELTGTGVPYEITTTGGTPIPASLSRSRLFPIAFLVEIGPSPAGTPLVARIDTIASRHWTWIYLGEEGSSWWQQTGAAFLSIAGKGDANVSQVAVSRVGLAQWSLAMPGGNSRQGRWLVVHVSNVLLFLAMLACLLLACGTAVTLLARRLRVRPMAPLANLAGGG